MIEAILMQRGILQEVAATTLEQMEDYMLQKLHHTHAVQTDRDLAITSLEGTIKLIGAYMVVTSEVDILDFGLLTLFYIEVYADRITNDGVFLHLRGNLHVGEAFFPEITGNNVAACL